jgi:hypothetical protein
LETILRGKIIKFFDADPGSTNGKNPNPVWTKFGSGMEKIRILYPG